MSYTPTLQDAASDFYRSVNCAISSQGFDNENFKIFFKNGLRIFSKNKSKLQEDQKKSIEKCLIKFKDNSLEFEKRCEQLLTAALILK